MIDRRQVTLAVLGGALASKATAAQERYPTKPVRVVVPFGPGGLADITIRIVAQKVSTLLDQQFVVINQPGAGGIVAAKAVLGAPADGYTLAMFTNGTAISVPLVKELGFDPLSEFAPISSLGFFDFLFMASADAVHLSLADFATAAKAKPDGLTIGTINIGSSQNLAAALFNSTYRLATTIVPFRNSPDVISALLRGDINLAVDGYAAAKSMLAAKKLRALATSGPTRASYLPTLPTVREVLGGDFEVTSWNALFARTGTPAEIIVMLNARLREALADAEVKARLIDLGIEARAGAPAEIRDRLAADIGKWRAVIERAGIPKQ